MIDNGDVGEVANGVTSFADVDEDLGVAVIVRTAVGGDELERDPCVDVFVVELPLPVGRAGVARHHVVMDDDGAAADGDEATAPPAPSAFAFDGVSEHEVVRDLGVAADVHASAMGAKRRVLLDPVAQHLHRPDRLALRLRVGGDARSAARLVVVHVVVADLYGRGPLHDDADPAADGAVVDFAGGPVAGDLVVGDDQRAAFVAVAARTADEPAGATAGRNLEPIDDRSATHHADDEGRSFAVTRHQRGVGASVAGCEVRTESAEEGVVPAGHPGVVAVARTEVAHAHALAVSHRVAASNLHDVAVACRGNGGADRSHRRRGRTSSAGTGSDTQHLRAGADPGARLLHSVVATTRARSVSLQPVRCCRCRFGSGDRQWWGCGGGDADDDADDHHPSSGRPRSNCMLRPERSPVATHRVVHGRGVIGPVSTTSNALPGTFLS